MLWLLIEVVLVYREVMVRDIVVIVGGIVFLYLME